LVFEKGMIYMKILKKRGVVEKRGEEETKSMPHAPVKNCTKPLFCSYGSKRAKSKKKREKNRVVSEIYGNHSNDFKIFI
jgi:hypothetical protein